LGEQKGMEILKGKGNRRGLEEYNIIRIIIYNNIPNT
jgi:hypothetical protein